MPATAETIRRPVNVKLDQLLDIVGLMQSTIDLTVGDSHHGNVVPIDYPKIKDIENGVPITYGIKVEYREKDLSGKGSGISKIIFSKNWTENSIIQSVEVTLELFWSIQEPQLQRLEKVNDVPSGVKTTREFSGDSNDEASINWALGISEKYIFLQRSKARI